MTKVHKIKNPTFYVFFLLKKQKQKNTKANGYQTKSQLDQNDKDFSKIKKLAFF